MLSNSYRRISEKFKNGVTFSTRCVIWGIENASTTSTLSSVTLDGNLNVTGPSSQVRITNGLTLNGQANLSGGAALNFINSNQQLSGSGSVSLVGSNASNGLISTTGQTLTIGPAFQFTGPRW